MSPSAMPGELQVETQKILGAYFDRVLFEDMDAKDAIVWVDNAHTS
jgi:hypothetical protein